MPLNEEIKPNQTIVIFVYLNRFYFHFQFEVLSRKEQWQKIKVLPKTMLSKVALHTTIVIFFYLNRFYFHFQFEVPSRKGQGQKIKVLPKTMLSKEAVTYNNCHISKFKLQSCYYINFWTNTFRKGMNPLILPAMD